MYKIIPPRAWLQLDDGPDLEVVKVASGGLRGDDRLAFLKYASHPLADWIQKNPPLPGEVYVHKIALYSSEVGGQNRNADLYSADMLSRDYVTFKQGGLFFKNHQNRDPKKSYGVIKEALWVPELGRVELITALNGTKEAAERNGGLVAETTLDKLARNIDVAVSQSCQVPGDYCNSCNHFARNRSEYCGPEHCKYGGCRSNLGRVFDDGFQLGVDNRKCRFFECSDVSDTRGADRGSFITGKVAQSDRVIGGAELAEQLGLVPPDYLLDPQTLGAVAMLRKLASQPRPEHPPAVSWDECVAIRQKRAHGHVRVPAEPRNDFDRHQLIADLAADGVILPPARWLAMATGAAIDKCAALYAGGLDPQRLLDNAELHERLIEAKYADSRLSPPRSYAWLAPSLAAQAEESSSAVIAGPVKFAATNAPTNVRDEAALRYLAYQAGALAKHANSTVLPIMLRECARHNMGLTA